MAPLEDLQSQDLEWISDFVMQQMVIMLRPMMEALQQTDATVDYAQNTVQRLTVDVSELRGDLDRTNKVLAVLRQGLGVQNEGKYILQRNLEINTRSVKRIEEQMEDLTEAVKGIEVAVGRAASDIHGAGERQDEMARQLLESHSALEELQSRVERVTSAACAVKENLLSNEARFDVWQRELRELRRHNLGIGPKLEDPWAQKKNFSPVETGNANSDVNCGPQAETITLDEGIGTSQGCAGLPSGDEAASSSRLPLLGGRSGGTSRPPEGGFPDGPRLRFSATMAKPQSRGTAN